MILTKDEALQVLKFSELVGNLHSIELDFDTGNTARIYDDGSIDINPYSETDFESYDNLQSFKEAYGIR